MNEQLALQKDTDIEVDKGRNSGRVFLRDTHMTNDIYQIRRTDIRNVIDSFGIYEPTKIAVYISAFNKSNHCGIRFCARYDGKNLEIGCHKFSQTNTRVIHKWAIAGPYA